MTTRASTPARNLRAFSECEDGEVSASEVLEALCRAGLRTTDPRLAPAVDALANRPQGEGRLAARELCELAGPSLGLIERALSGELVVPDFPAFAEQAETVFDRAREQSSGTVADYIPQLARVPGDLFGAAFCTIDGQRLDLGDSSTRFCLQSTCKPLNYALALEEHGSEKVHRHVGREPSGRSFNELALNGEGLPHNPLVNAGAIMCAALLRRKQGLAERFDHVMQRWRLASGGEPIGFSNAVYQSERATADRNFALGYMMREAGAFPEGSQLQEDLDLYFQSCSIELDVAALSVFAATLANGGVCPITDERVFDSSSVQHVLSLMLSCGMYDFSGEFAFSIGLPAKSGVSGAILVVVPNVMGFASYSPRLDAIGNSVRGIALCQGLVERYNFHLFDDLTGRSPKTDPRRRASLDRRGLVTQRRDGAGARRFFITATGANDHERR